MQNIEQFRPVIEIAQQNTFIFFLLTSFLLAGFSYEVRVEIRERDGKCKGCGTSKTKLEAAHFNHSRKYTKYNDPENGRALCVRCHYLDHYKNQKRNGLTKQQNDWALNKIWERLTEEEKKGLTPPPPDQSNTKSSWQQGSFSYGD